MPFRTFPGVPVNRTSWHCSAIGSKSFISPRPDLLPLSPVTEILRKYDYVIPIISNQQYNLRLKIVADYAGLDRNLTVHMSRHTFATMCLNNGVKMENVSKMLGHTNVRTTQQYAKVLNAEVEKDFEMLERILS